MTIDAYRRTRGIGLVGASPPSLPLSDWARERDAEIERNADLYCAELVRIYVADLEQFPLDETPTVSTTDTETEETA